MSAQSDLAKLVRRALKCPHGWSATYDGRGHRRLVLPDGSRVVIPASTSDVNCPRNVAKQLSAACGCMFWNRGGRGRSRTHTVRDAFDPSRAAVANEEFHMRNPDYEDLPRHYADLLAAIAAVDPRRDPDHARELAGQVVLLEQRMDALHIPFDRNLPCDVS